MCKRDLNYVRYSKVFGHGIGVTEKEREYLRERNVYNNGEVINFIGYINNKNINGYCELLKRKNKNEK